MLVMELLGPSIEDLLQMCSKRLSIATILTLAEQMVFTFPSFVGNRSHELKRFIQKDFCIVMSNRTIMRLEEMRMQARFTSLITGWPKDTATRKLTLIFLLSKERS